MKNGLSLLLGDTSFMNPFISDLKKTIDVEFQIINSKTVIELTNRDRADVNDKEG